MYMPIQDQHQVVLSEKEQNAGQWYTVVKIYK